MAAAASAAKLECDGNHGTEPTSLAADDYDPPFHKYNPLPTATSIRLLRILPSPAGYIRCELNTVDLENDIKFDELSYTWGNPITLYERPDEELQACNPSDAEEVMLNSGASEVVDQEKKSFVVDLEAFTYRTQHPFIPHEEVSNDTEKTHPIICNGSRMLVTENLFEALCMFWRYAMREIAVPEDTFKASFPRPLSVYFWIDAICINQKDKLERNAQVMIMGRIYSMAQNVFGWIGKTDVFSKLGFAPLFDLFKRIHADPSIQDRWYESLYDVEGISERDWLSLFAVQRLWFRREWIVQEVLFASRFTMICGSTIFRWVVVEDVLRFMAKTRLDERVSEMVQHLMRKEPFLKQMRMMRKATMPARDYGSHHHNSKSPKLTLFVNPKTAYTFVAGVRFIKQRLGMANEYLYKLPKETADSYVSQGSHKSDEPSSRPFEASRAPVMDTNGDLRGSNGEDGYSVNRHATTEPYPKMTSARYDPSLDMALLHINPGPQPPISLLSILATFRMCSASDPRDKIFAFLNLAEKGRVESTLNHAILKADYGSTVQEVYIMATVSMLETSGLAVLSHVQDPSLTQVSGLPSWVPDFSVDIGRSIIEVEEFSPWAASGNTQEASFKVTDSSHLILEGVMIDMISGVTSLEGCYFERVAKLALNTPQWYLNNHGLPPTFTSYSSDASDNSRGPLLLPSPEDTDFPYISRVEALWRTLTADSLELNSPAPASCGFGFSDWVSLHLERTEKLASLDIILPHLTTTQKKYIQSRLTSKFNHWKALDADEVGGFYTLEEIELAKRTSYQTKTTAEIDGRGLRYLLDSRRLDQVAKRELHFEKDSFRTVQTNNLAPHEKIRLSVFESRMREVKAGRRLFPTEGGYLGMGSVSVELGGQVWVLRGGNVPFVLRSVGNGSYRMIGEAYVHGIMRGEVLREREKGFGRRVWSS
jgi:hypothetical protein